MDKVRISEIAQELGMEAKEILVKAKEVDLVVKAANSTVSTEEAGNLMDYVLTGVYKGPKKEVKEEKPKATVKKVEPEKAEAEPKKIETPVEVKVEKTEPKVEVKKEPELKVETPTKKETIEKVEKPIKEEKAEKVETTKVETPKVDEPKTEPKQEIKKEEPPKKETLAQSSLKKRRGLVIVRKKKAKPVPEAITSGRKKMIEMPQIVDGAQKKKKKIKRGASAKQDGSQRIDMFGGGNMSSIEILGDDEMVVLHDFDFTDKKSFDTDTATKKKFDPTKMRATKQSSFTQFRGISRKSKKRRRRKEEPEVVNVSSIEIPEDIRVYEFAEKLNRPISDVIKVLFTLGVMVTKNDF